MTRQRKRHARNGLSIYEVLIVIAVILLLLSLLFPVLRRGKDVSLKAVCADNLRQLSSAFVAYSNEWSGYWPAPGGLYGDKTYWSQTGRGGLENYVKQRGLKTVWCCPKLTDWGGKYPPRSYSMNSYLRTPSDKEYPNCLSLLCGVMVCRIQVPSQTVLLFEGMPLVASQIDPLDYLYRCANWTKVRGFVDGVAYTVESGKPWHGLLNNYLYCDGHIAARLPGRSTTASLSTGSEMYQWYVDKNYFMNDLWARNWSRSAPWK